MKGVRMTRGSPSCIVARGLKSERVEQERRRRVKGWQ